MVCPARQSFTVRAFARGDSISPLLFVIAIDPLQRLLDLATRKKLLHRIRGRGVMVRTSLYADDVLLLIRPTRPDLMFVREAIMIFGEASGLRINFAKSSAIMIRAEEEDEELVK